MLNPPSPVTKAAKDGMLGQSASNSIYGLDGAGGDASNKMQAKGIVTRRAKTRPKNKNGRGLVSIANIAQ